MGKQLDGIKLKRAYIDRSLWVHENKSEILKNGSPLLHIFKYCDEDCITSYSDKSLHIKVPKKVKLRVERY